MTNVNEVVKKYVELRDEQSELSKRHAEEMKPFADKMAVIEDWLHKEMDKMGVDSLKTPSGTPYKSVTKSVKLSDPESFKKFCFQPVIDALKLVDTPNMPDILGLLTAGIRWDIIDFRPLKKGVSELVENEGVVPPGLTMDNFVKINIRRG